MTSNPTYNVMMHSDFANELERLFSPTDEIQAIDDFYVELPKVHRSVESGRRRHKFRKTFKAYHGWLEWGGVGFTYVQVGDHLHVVEFWHDLTQSRHVDVVIGRHTGAP